MDNNQKNYIGEVFVQKKAESEAVLVEIYKEIARNVAKQPPEWLAQAVLQQESPKVNAYIKNLRQELKAAACRAMVACGLSEAVSGIVWANVMNSAGSPKVSLCQKQDIPVTPSMPQKPAGPNKKQQEEINRLESLKNVGIGLAAVGAAAGIVTCLVVPGWSGIAGVVKAASIVVIGTGVAGIVTSKQRIEEINRIVTQTQRESVSQKNINAVIDQVCEHQCRSNAAIIQDWMDRVYAELITQCELELAR